MENSFYLCRSLPFLINAFLGGIMPAWNLSFPEPQAHARARLIMGSNFHGLDSLQTHFGSQYSVPFEHRTTVQLTNRDGVLYDEETSFRIMHRLRDTHVLVATSGLSLVNMHSHHSRFFGNEPMEAWFQDGGQRRKWAATSIRQPWMLVSKTMLPSSLNQTMDAQEQLVPGADRMPLPAEYIFAAMMHLFDTGEKLCPQGTVRFPVKAIEGRYYVTANWQGDRMYICGWNDGKAEDHTGICLVAA